MFKNLKYVLGLIPLLSSAALAEVQPPSIPSIPTIPTIPTLPSDAQQSAPLKASEINNAPTNGEAKIENNQTNPSNNASPTNSNVQVPAIAPTMPTHNNNVPTINIPTPSATINAPNVEEPSLKAHPNVNEIDLKATATPQIPTHAIATPSIPGLNENSKNDGKNNSAKETDKIVDKKQQEDNPKNNPKRTKGKQPEVKKKIQPTPKKEISAPKFDNDVQIQTTKPKVAAPVELTPKDKNNKAEEDIFENEAKKTDNFKKFNLDHKKVKVPSKFYYDENDPENRHLPKPVSNIEYVKASFMAIENHDMDSLQEFTKEAGSLDLVDNENNSLLVYAVVFDSPEIANWLIKNNVDVNASNTYNATALHAAVFKNNLKMVELLLANKAKLLPDNNNMTPLDYANKKGYTKIENILKRHSKKK